MPLQYDPEFAQVFEAIRPHLPKRKKLDLHNLASARQEREASIKAAFDRIPNAQDVQETRYYAKTSDGFRVLIHAFTKRQTGPEETSAIVHFHGGGLVLGSSQTFANYLADLVSKTSVPIFSVNYRLAPEFKGPTMLEDCYTAITWIYGNAESLKIDKSRIALFGESAGGCLAVGAALLAKERNLEPPLAKQILVYPMLDDRTITPNPAVEPLAFWKTDDNATAWRAVSEGVSFIAPARTEDVSGLPSAYIDVGSLDIFRDESMEYARRLLAEDVQVELHVYPGLPHAFEMIAPGISATRKANENRIRAILSI